MNLYFWITGRSAKHYIQRICISGFLYKGATKRRTLWVVSRCGQKWTGSKDIQQLCEDIDLKNKSLFQPVITRENIVYRNRYCAICNNVSMTKELPISTKVRANCQKTEKIRETIENGITYNHARKYCECEFDIDRPIGYFRNDCPYCIRDLVMDQCPFEPSSSSSSSVDLDSDICKLYSAPQRRNIFAQERTIYKNPHCAKCQDGGGFDLVDSVLYKCLYLITVVRYNNIRIIYSCMRVQCCIYLANSCGTPYVGNTSSTSGDRRLKYLCDCMIILMNLIYVIFLLFSMYDHVMITHYEEPLIPGIDPDGIQSHQKLMGSHQHPMFYDMTLSYAQAYGCFYDNVTGTTHRTESPHEVDNWLNIILTILMISTYAAQTRQVAVLLFQHSLCYNRMNHSLLSKYGPLVQFYAFCLFIHDVRDIISNYVRPLYVSHQASTIYTLRLCIIRHIIFELWYLSDVLICDTPLKNLHENYT